MAEKSGLGLEFASWASLPSISETIMGMQHGGKRSPLAMALGSLIDTINTSGSSSQPPEGSAPAPANMSMGQGLSIPNKAGVNPYAAPVGMGAPDYKLPMQQPGSTTLPSLGQPVTDQPSTDSYTKYLFAPR
jgi:hypothetical protein